MGLVAICGWIGIEEFPLDSEDVPKLLVLVKAVGIAEGMPCLVAKQVVDLSRVMLPPADLSVQLLEQRVGVVESDLDIRGAADAAPVLSKIEARPELDAAAFQPRQELFDLRLDQRGP